MKLFSDISVKTGLSENIVKGMALLFIGVFLYFVYIQMNKKKENFTDKDKNEKDIVKKIVTDKSDREQINEDLKKYCKDNNNICKNSFRSLFKILFVSLI